MSQAKYIPRLQSMYKEKVQKELVGEFSYKNANQVPKLEKIILSTCTRDAVTNAKVLDHMSQEFASITGQKPITTKAKKSIAAFKLRQGIPIGLKVTLRKQRMYEFLDRLIAVALPRTRDFKGCNINGFDGRGTYNLGLKEHIIFPEVNYDKIDKIRGLNVTIVTSAKNNIEARALLKAFGFPFGSEK